MCRSLGVFARVCHQPFKHIPRHKIGDLGAVGEGVRAVRITSGNT